MSIFVRRQEMEIEKWLTLYQLSGARGHVFSKIEDAFMVMALPYTKDERKRRNEFMRKMVERWCSAGPMRIDTRKVFADGGFITKRLPRPSPH